ncbi:MAG: histidine kinase [Microbacterium sp.]|uniref:SseB family protein n=1 Tax=Microbacterium sp. TaxID=51671 RepID=UPI000DB22D45|nr:SseB family protein [Microbacterium sp.]PZU40183.1 MAG: histidine kinase [Microbacterium sp.]
MALFSRRPKATDASTSDDTPADDTAAEDTAAGGSEERADAVADEGAEPTPQVNISLSTFRGVGALGPQDRARADAATPARTTPASPATMSSAETAPPNASRVQGPAEAPPPRESVPGLKDNVLLHAALARLSEKPTARELLDVARQLLQNHVFLRVRGDARALLAEGKELPLAVAKRGDEQFMLVYSSGEALQAAVQADGQADTSAVAQPALAVLRHMMAGPYAGLLIDGAAAQARAVLPRAVLEPALAQADPQLRVKTALAAERTPETAASLAQTLSETPIWVAVRENTPADGQAPRMGIAEARTADGRRLLEVYSHPLEIVAMARGDRPMPFTPAQLGKALRDHPELSGVLVDAAGPWLIVDRDTLAPVLALPEPPAAAPEAPAAAPEPDHTDSADATG